MTENEILIPKISWRRQFPMEFIGLFASAAKSKVNKSFYQNPSLCAVQFRKTRWRVIVKVTLPNGIVSCSAEGKTRIAALKVAWDLAQPALKQIKEE